jgi:hypothetical protein
MIRITRVFLVLCIIALLAPRASSAQGSNVPACTPCSLRADSIRIADSTKHAAAVAARAQAARRRAAFVDDSIKKAMADEIARLKADSAARAQAAANTAVATAPDVPMAPPAPAGIQSPAPRELKRPKYVAEQSFFRRNEKPIIIGTTVVVVGVVTGILLSRSVHVTSVSSSTSIVH